MFKTTQLGGLFLRRLGPVLKPALLLMVNVLKPLAKSVLTLIGLTAASATDASFQKKIFGLRRSSDLALQTTTLIFSNEKLNIIRIIIYLEDSGLLIKCVTETVESELKEQKGGFLGILAATL